MISLLLAERYLFGNTVIDLLYPLISPNHERPWMRLVAEGEASFTEPVFWALRMSLAAFVLCLVFSFVLIVVLHIPLPEGIADRVKLQFFEFILRVSNEYSGDLVEVLFGPNIRNKFTRFLVALVFLLQQGPPKGITLRVEDWDGVSVRCYIPEKRKSKAALVFIHGGGWAIMKAKYYDGTMYRLIARLGITVFSIDYRLAPEHPYPVGANDCESALKTLFYKKFEDFDVDRNRIAVAGDSAGVLIYPVIHGFDFKSPSYNRYYNEYKGSALLNPVQMARWYLLYVGLPATRKNVEKLVRNEHIPEEFTSSRKLTALVDRQLLPKTFLDDLDSDSGKQFGEARDPTLASTFGRIIAHPDISPLFGEDLHGLPPALILTAGYDILRDEGALYVKRLQSFKVPVEWNHYPAAFHGVFNMPLSRQRNQIKNDIASFLERHL